MILQQLAVQVASVGEDVLLAVGSSSWRMHFETALLLSWRMRRAGKESKRFAGDVSRVFGVQGALHDAEKGINAGQPFTPGGVFPVNRNLLRLDRISVKSERATVVVKLSDASMGLPYQAAFVIAQWIRLRAKESKVRAGDTSRHWSAIAQQDVA